MFGGWEDIEPSFWGDVGIPGISVDHFRDLTKKAYFLSHFHTDHCVGLIGNRHSTALKKKGNAKIYMTETTKVFFENSEDYGSDYNNVKDQIVTLEPGKHAFEVDGGIYDVTLIPVDHMPGAVMFLFQGAFGDDDNIMRTVLYTGDFTITNEDLPSAFPALFDEKREPIPIDVMYCDNTHEVKFKNRVLRSLPSRSTILDAAVKLIRDWLSENESNAVAIRPYYSYGYEELFANISKGTGQSISLRNESQLESYGRIFSGEDYVYTNQPSRIHVCPRKGNVDCDCLTDKSKKYMCIILKLENSEEPVPKKPSFDLDNPECTLNYPTHCSKNQLNEFIALFPGAKVEYFPTK